MVIITAGVTGIVTSVTMIGPLLVDVARDLDVSIGQAGRSSRRSRACSPTGSGASR